MVLFEFCLNSVCLAFNPKFIAFMWNCCCWLILYLRINTLYISVLEKIIKKRMCFDCGFVIS